VKPLSVPAAIALVFVLFWAVIGAVLALYGVLVGLVQLTGTILDIISRTYQ